MDDAVRLSCVACSATCDIFQARCGCGSCAASEAAFHAGGWMDWKGKMYCHHCIARSGWTKRAEEKAERHFQNQLDEMCAAVMQSAIFKPKKSARPQLVLDNAQSGISTNATSSNASSSPSNGQVDRDEVQALRRTVEALIARVDTLEDMKRAKRTLDARLDDFEDRLTLMNSNVNANRERIEVLEMDQDNETDEAAYVMTNDQDPFISKLLAEEHSMKEIAS